MQTAPINMMVAVPAFQHSPMFGHLASSQTVLSRCSRTISLTAAKWGPPPKRARSHAGLGWALCAAADRPATSDRPAVSDRPAAAGLTPSLIAVKPWGVVYFSPLRAGRCCTATGMPLNSDIA